MNTLCILQVEDDDNDVFFLQHAFQEAGITHSIQRAKDGQEAIEYLAGAGEFADRKRYPLPCLTILDLKMPRKGGLEVLEWLREESNLSSLPVIVFSSSAQPSDIDRAYELGANSFVVKPASMDKRVQFAHLLKGYWLQFNQLPACIEIEAGTERK